MNEHPYPYSGATGVTAPEHTVQVGGLDGSGNLRTMSVETDGSINVNIVSGGGGGGGDATAANQVTMITALQIMDDWDESDRAKVNPIVGQAGVAAGSGAVDALTQRVTLASDDPAVALLGTIDADTGSIATATSAIQTAVQVMDDWDESDRAKVNIIAGQAGVTAGAGNVAANTPRVTLAADDPAVALLGTIDADTGGILTAVQVIDDWDESDRAKVNIIVGQAGVTAGAGSVAANTPRVTMASDSPDVTALQIMDDWDNAASDGASVSGDVAHDSVDAGEPVKIGGRAVAHGANPTAVAAADRTHAIFNRAGIQFVIGGHPNTLTKNLNITDADGAQTDADIIGAIGSGTKYVITHLTVTADNANTGDVAVRIGFGTANVPAADAAGIVLAHPGIAPGSGVSLGNGGGIIAVGGDGAELRVTCEDPAGGAIDIVVGYFTIES